MSGYASDYDCVRQTEPLISAQPVYPRIVAMAASLTFMVKTSCDDTLLHLGQARMRGNEKPSFEVFRRSLFRAPIDLDGQILCPNLARSPPLVTAFRGGQKSKTFTRKDF